MNVNREIRSLFAIQTINNAGFSASFPFIAIYLLNVRGIPFSEIGTIYLISGALGIVGQVFSGRLTDTIGIKRMMLIDFSLCTALYVLLALLVSGKGDVILFFVLYPLLFLFNSASQLTVSSIVADWNLSKMMGGFAILYIGLNLGFMIGPATGGLLITYYGYTMLFVLGAICSTTAACITLAGVRENIKYAQRETVDRISEAGGRPNKELFLFLSLVFLSWFAVSYEIIPLSAYASNFLKLPDFLIGYLVATNGLVIVLLQLPFSRMMRGKNIILSLVVASILQSIGYFLAASLRSFIGLEIVMILVSVAEILIAVPSQVIVSFYSKGHNRGAYQGYYYAASRTAGSIASFVGPITFALFVGAPGNAWYLVSAIALASGIGFAILSTRFHSDLGRAPS